MKFELPAVELFYNGFYLEEPEGNNAFSYDRRVNKKIFIPPVCKGTLKDVKAGQEIVFSEIEDGIEHNKTGLQKFVITQFKGKETFVFDNHNHAFFFWLYGFKKGIIPAGLPLVHVDQHSDMRDPPRFPDFKLNGNLDLEKVFAYTNRTLNVGNFIKPALALKLFSKAHVINASKDFDIEFDQPLILDLDLDVFAPEMRYIDDGYKIERIRQWIEKACLITVATSPFFMDQDYAVRLINEIFA
ncbi:MAG: hypothetical protein GXO77_12905 [Calditrichaeota bacterium]|nr:hypothetical protein [Calditrichota bacterium]